MQKYLKYIPAVLLIGIFILTSCSAVEETDEAVVAEKKITYQELFQQEEQVLTSYKVLDAEKGVYQVPIERAMELLAAENSN